MSKTKIYASIEKAMQNAPRKERTAEMHLQMIKYADELEDISSREFCEGVGLKPSFGTEFSKMRNIVRRLKAAELKPELI